MYILNHLAMAPHPPMSGHQVTCPKDQDTGACVYP